MRHDYTVGSDSREQARLAIIAPVVMTPLFTSYLELEAQDVPGLLHAWREDAMTFLRHDMPKLGLVLVGAFVLIRVLQVVTQKIAEMRGHKFTQGLRAQQIRTLAAVINSVGVFVILFVAGLQALSLLGLNLGPLLASAGIAGLAIGFGAQTLVKDWINGFFVLFEDQFNIGDTVRMAGVKGVVEEMSLRRTVLRDDDGTLHMVPNSQMTILSNMTRDWAQIALRVTVAYSEPSDKIVALLEQIGNAVRHDPAFADDIVSDIQVPGIDRVGNGETEYLMLIKTRPNRQYPVSRELRKRIKDSFLANNIQAGAPGRVYVADPAADAKAS
jgi:moderate conductance mechanosensitive channel